MIEVEVEVQCSTSRFKVRKDGGQGQKGQKSSFKVNVQSQKG